MSDDWRTQFVDATFDVVDLLIVSRHELDAWCLVFVWGLVNCRSVLFEGAWRYVLDP